MAKTPMDPVAPVLNSHARTASGRSDRYDSDTPGELVLPELGPILVVSPHPDDETLGCGGLIARCARLQWPVTILSLTNGDGSHPGDERWRAELATIREREQRLALRRLGLHSPDLVSEAFADGSLAFLDPATEAALVSRIAQLIRQRGIRSVFVPAIDDCHNDHRAAARLLCQAVQGAPVARVLCYQIWPPHKRASHVGDNEIPCWHTMADLVETKRHAIHAHRSQLQVIDHEHAEGFRLPESLLRQKLRSRECYALVRDIPAWSR